MLELVSKFFKSRKYKNNRNFKYIKKVFGLLKIYKNTKSQHTTILRVLLKPPTTDQPTHRPLSTDPLTTDHLLTDPSIGRHQLTLK